jgi:hypothetical protein
MVELLQVGCTALCRPAERMLYYQATETVRYKDYLPILLQ